MYRRIPFAVPLSRNKYRDLLNGIEKVESNRRIVAKAVMNTTTATGSAVLRVLAMALTGPRRQGSKEEGAREVEGKG